ncbi:MAG: nitroreductase family protein [Bacteroidales bacterium]|nr:nitroreductase family protein [Bacteroidales bacterium]
MKKDADNKNPINELQKKRWSPRSFADTEIPKGKIYSMFEAASWAASSRNEQPWRFIYGLKGEGENYKKIIDTLVSWNQKWAKTAPMLVVGVAKLNSDYHNKPNEYAHYDLGQAVAAMSLQAISDGIYVHQMGGFEKDKVRNSFKMSDNYEPMVAIAVGYLGQPEDLPDDMRELEEKPRTRYELNRLIFNGDFKP